MRVGIGGVCIGAVCCLRWWRRCCFDAHGNGGGGGSVRGYRSRRIVGGAWRWTWWVWGMVVKRVEGN